MKKLILIMVFLFIFTAVFSGNVNAVDDSSGELILGVGLLPGAYDLNLALKSDIFGISGNYTNIGYSYEEHTGSIGLFQLSGRLYSPISYENNDIYLEAGIGRASFDSDDGNFNISSPAYNLGAGFKSPIAGNFKWGIKAGMLVLPPDEISSQFYAGVSLNIALPVTPTEVDRSATRVDAEENGDAGEIGHVSTPSKVDASGTISGSNIGYSVSGNWSLSADFANNTASFSVSGSSEDGSYSYSVSGSPQYSNGRVILNASRSGSHEGKSVSGSARITIDSSSISIRINARREDGLTASATVSGSTNSYREQ